MRTIMLEIDDLSANSYEDLSMEIKQQLSQEFDDLVRKIIFDERVTKLKKIVEDINNDPAGIEIAPEILYALLRIED